MHYFTLPLEKMNGKESALTNISLSMYVCIYTQMGEVVEHPSDRPKEIIVEMFTISRRGVIEADLYPR